MFIKNIEKDSRKGPLHNVDIDMSPKPKTKFNGATANIRVLLCVYFISIL